MTLNHNINAYDADVNPISQHLHQGFVCVTHEDMEPTNISLKIDKRVIPFSNPIEHGPVTIGSDSAVLEATVTNVSGILVPGTTVSFTMEPNSIGYLNGAAESSAVTNGRGQAYSSYQPPTSADDLGYYSVVVRDSENPSYPPPDYKEVVISDVNAGIEGKEQDTYLYQVLKDDLLQGICEKAFDDWAAIPANVDIPEWVVMPPPASATYDKWKAEFVLKHNIQFWTGLVNGKLSGRKVIVYSLVPDPAAIDPTEDGTVLGAYVPTRPVSIDKITGGYRLIYPAAALVNCDPTCTDPLIPGGYWIVLPRAVTFQAYCWSSYYNRNIYSNKIAARIILPSYLLGEYLNNLDRIPFGWKLPMDTDNVAAGINGATFITINPYGPPGEYPVYDLVGCGTPPADVTKDEQGNEIKVTVPTWP